LDTVRFVKAIYGGLIVFLIASAKVAARKIYSVLGPMVNADENSNLGQTSRSGLRSYVDDYKYEQFYFFVFGNSKTTFNLGDAGNFMWGMAGRRSGFTYIELKGGSNYNELRQGRGFDSGADQRAIKAGFNFGR
jgi:hypothetical protein